MIRLKPITLNNISDFIGTSYDNMPAYQKQKMIQESIDKIYNNSYFEILVAHKNDTVMGFVNMFAHSQHIISCAPEIKDEFRCKGFGLYTVVSALNYAKDRGYTIAVADIEDSNVASIKLHEKLDFELLRKYNNKHEKTVRLYMKAL